MIDPYIFFGTIFIPKIFHVILGILFFKLEKIHEPEKLKDIEFNRKD